VRWLCTPHHRQHHAQHGPGLNAFRVQPADKPFTTNQMVAMFAQVLA
jgi:hypothetical protein